VEQRCRRVRWTVQSRQDGRQGDLQFRRWPLVQRRVAPRPHARRGPDGVARRLHLSWRLQEGPAPGRRHPHVARREEVPRPVVQRQAGGERSHDRQRRQGDGREMAERHAG
ncbi:unnamed protein product, partial [Prorocentrum cordatum]